MVYPEDGAIDVITSPDQFEAVKDAMEKRRLQAGAVGRDHARRERHRRRPARPREQVVKMLDMLEDLDDVQNVYSNADLGAEAYQ